QRGLQVVELLGLHRDLAAGGGELVGEVAPQRVQPGAAALDRPPEDRTLAGRWSGRRRLTRAAGLGDEAGTEGPDAARGQRAAAHEREGDHHRDHDPGGAAVARAVRLVRPGWAGSGRLGTRRARRHGPWRAPRWRRTRWRRARWRAERRRPRWRAERRRLARRLPERRRLPGWRAERRRRLGRRTGWWGLHR